MTGTETGEDYTAMLQRQICAAFDVKPWEIGIAPVPRKVRMLAPLRWRWWWWRVRRTWYRLTYREKADDDA